VNRKKILDAFFQALNREAHVLTRHPELLWQQLYNRYGGNTHIYANISSVSGDVTDAKQ
jgi:hypothetical protein